MEITIADLGPVKLPDFFILGAAKSGTSSLFRYLGEHPQIHSPAVKEPWFFSFPPPEDTDVPIPNLAGAITELPDYVEQFSDCGENQITGEASPSYLFTPAVSIPKIKALYGPERAGQLKFFILLRNPVDRAWSKYWTFGRKLMEELEFEEAIQPAAIAARKAAGERLFYDYIGAGRYCSQIRAYQEAFAPEQIKIILFEDLISDTANICRECYALLGVDPDFAPDTAQVYNVSGRPTNTGIIRFLKADNPFKSVFKSLVSPDMRRRLKRMIGKRVLEKVKMKPETRQELIAVYRDEILELQDLLGRDLGHWLR